MFHFALKLINNSKAKGALVILIPDSMEDGESATQLQSTVLFVIPKPFEIITFTSVHDNVILGTYKVLVYDIEENGLLNMPNAMPAIVSTVTTMERATFTNSKIIKPQDVNITVDTFKHFLTINCTYISGTDINIQGCLVIVFSILNPEQLHVQTQLRDSPYPLVYTVDPETKYTITAFAVKKGSGIINSTIHSMEINVGPGRFL